MFTPIETSIGALLLHQATSILLHNNGSILGCSGFIRRLFTSPSGFTLTFFVGMASSFLPLKIFLPELLTRYPPVPASLQVAMVTVSLGALVGWGTKACNGCTSGHMLCGLGRLSARSELAVAVFFPAAIVSHHLVHPSLLTETCTGQVPCYTPTYPSRQTFITLIILTALTILSGRMIPRLIANLTTPTKPSEDTETLTISNLAAYTTTLFLSGMQFGLGLQISQMASPAKVASFLSFPSLQHWDPSLALVFAFGVLPNFVENWCKGFDFRSSPAFAVKYDLPKMTCKDVDRKFIVGAAVFGIGWGLSGTCPGPAALRAVAQPQWGFLWMGGFWLGGLV
ncbi:YeeE/YedE family integral membrane protein-like protein [Massarina eburnea CBS 473.64]|uniref:YeeE/YedE family integral membrane protein-like protein n=1 Tax=Massarina eburnea CBS 473.64 TaxID=1395130 RepID=A0A6A6RKK2_9PLEO|nr:YeeE/YedE family integral membrane protein-like protein [Massarina eburnea CBS 473.64]